MLDGCRRVIANFQDNYGSKNSHAKNIQFPGQDWTVPRQVTSQEIVVVADVESNLRNVRGKNVENVARDELKTKPLIPGIKAQGSEVNFLS